MRILAKFKLKLSEKQRKVMQNLYQVQHLGNLEFINVQPIFDLEKRTRSNEIYEKIKLDESNEELKMDLGGYVGDFHRHRVSKEIKKREPMSEHELMVLMTADDRLKDITLAFREIDPFRNGYITQQELDDIFRENYHEKMDGKNMFGLIKEFRSITNKILVDYNKFKKWIISSLKAHKKSL